MNRFNVWLRALGSYTKLHVEGRANADWLRQRLEDHGFKCAIPLAIQGTQRCVFRVEHSQERQRTAVQEFVESLPEVQTMHPPE